jgi:4-alpha-glucanotransferase
MDLSEGYHWLDMHVGDGGIGGPVNRCLLVLSPPQCDQPPILQSGRRLWGVAVQLYTLRSRYNWGIGDFADLETLIRWLAPLGAGFIGLNPLHALAPADPGRSSPYSASNRQFLNVLYIAVPRVEEFHTCEAAQRLRTEAQFVKRLDACRAATLVDYRAIATLKFEILELLYGDFCERHLRSSTARARRYQAFVAAGGDALQMHARFDALDRHWCAMGSASGWQSWPLEYHDSQGAAAALFAAERTDSIGFFLYLQWLVYEQLQAAQNLCRELGMPIGLYGDYAVGAHPSGSETWSDRTAYSLGAEIGAPPDPLALKGQGWGIPPQDPQALQAQWLQSFVRLIRANMGYYGALRLDHVMSLFRLWWVAAGKSPAQGAYVHYPLAQLLAVLALESTRARCLVIGEDLGVVPDEIRRAVPEFGLYHYKVLIFEKTEGRFRRPSELAGRALATITTHDLPTMAGYWSGRDIEMRTRLHLFPSDEIRAEIIRERDHDRAALLAALREQGLAPARPALPHEPFSADLAQALHLYLAGAQPLLVSLQIEDLLGVLDPVNVPGTHHEYPNWQRKLPVDVEAMALNDDINARLGAINRARG